MNLLCVSNSLSLNLGKNPWISFSNSILPLYFVHVNFLSQGDRMDRSVHLVVSVGVFYDPPQT